MKRRLQLVLVVAIGIAVLFTLDGYYRYHTRRDNAHQLGTALELVRQNLQLGIGRSVVIVEDLRAFLLASPALPDVESFNRYAAGVLSQPSEVRALEYADQDSIIRYVYPLEGNEAALNLDLKSRPAAAFRRKGDTDKVNHGRQPSHPGSGHLIRRRAFSAFRRGSIPGPGAGRCRSFFPP